MAHATVMPVDRPLTDAMMDSTVDEMDRMFARLPLFEPMASE